MSKIQNPLHGLVLPCIDVEFNTLLILHLLYTHGYRYSYFMLKESMTGYDTSQTIRHPLSHLSYHMIELYIKLLYLYSTFLSPTLDKLKIMRHNCEYIYTLFIEAIEKYNKTNITKPIKLMLLEEPETFIKTHELIKSIKIDNRSSRYPYDTKFNIIAPNPKDIDIIKTQDALENIFSITLFDLSIYYQQIFPTHIFLTIDTNNKINLSYQTLKNFTVRDMVFFRMQETDLRKHNIYFYISEKTT